MANSSKNQVTVQRNCWLYTDLHIFLRKFCNWREILILLPAAIETTNNFILSWIHEFKKKNSKCFTKLLGWEEFISWVKIKSESVLESYIFLGQFLVRYIFVPSSISAFFCFGICPVLSQWISFNSILELRSILFIEITDLWRSYITYLFRKSSTFYHSSLH